MQRDPRFFTGKTSHTHTYEPIGFARNTPMGGRYAADIPVAPASGATLAGTNQEFPIPLNGIEFQPSEICPQNFVIFDQTDKRSRVMFHPALAHKFSCPNFNIRATVAALAEKNRENGDDFSSHKEDTEDINALLSSEEDEEDDLVSTGRSPGDWGGGSPYSSRSMGGFKSRKMNSASQDSFPSSGGGGGSGSGSSSSEKKRERTRKMVRALKGIVPGGEDMDTPAILDEAVRYLKSLKVEVNKLGIQDFEN